MSAVQGLAGTVNGALPREAEVIALIPGGLSNEKIAERAHISRNSIKSYIRSAYREIGDVPYTGSSRIDVVGAVMSVVGMGVVVLGILVLVVGAVALAALARWLLRRKRTGEPALIDPTCSGIRTSPPAPPGRSSSRSCSAAR